MSSERQPKSDSEWNGKWHARNQKKISKTNHVLSKKNMVHKCKSLVDHVSTAFCHGPRVRARSMFFNALFDQRLYQVWRDDVSPVRNNSVALSVPRGLLIFAVRGASRTVVLPFVILLLAYTCYSTCSFSFVPLNIQF